MISLIPTTVETTPEVVTEGGITVTESGLEVTEMSLAQIGTSIIFDAFYADTIGVGVASLTVTVDVYDYAGTKVVSDGAVTEVGGGLYTYTLSSGATGSAGNYRAVFKTASSGVAQKHLPALWVVGQAWVERIDAAVSSVSGGGGSGATVEEIVEGMEVEGGTLSLIKAKTDRIGTSTVQVMSPVAASGKTTIYAGYDMLAEDGMSLEYSIPDSITGDLSEAEAHFVAHYSITGLDLTGIVLVDSRLIRFEPRATETAHMLVPGFPIYYDVYLMWEGKTPVIVKSGVLMVDKRIS